MTSDDLQDQAEATIRSIPETVKMVILQPAEFLKTMPKTGGFMQPLVFLVIMAVISAVVQSIGAALSLGPALGPYGGLSFLGLAIAPLIWVIGGFLAAAILLVIWMMMGSKENYETSFRILAYFSALGPIMALANLIPYLGVFVWAIWGSVLYVLASIHVHRVSVTPAVVVFGIIGLILLVFGLWGQYASRNLQEAFSGLESYDPSNPQDLEELLEQLEALENLDPNDPEDLQKIMEELRKQQESQ